MKIVGIIPARYKSTRFPGKPLAIINGKPMIQWVYETVSKNQNLDKVLVATDDDRIVDAVRRFNGNVVKTGECKCGTDRVYEATRDLDCDVVINVQGDEPLIENRAIDDIISAFRDNSVNIAILKKKIDKKSKEINDVNVCKVITDSNGDAIYFSRYPIPFNRDNDPNLSYYKALGIYGYKKDFLAKFAKMNLGYIENAEKLEPIRVLEHGHRIRVIETAYDGKGVDIPEHIEEIESIMKERLNERKSGRS